MRVVAQAEEFTTATSGPVVVQIWHQVTTLDGVQALHRAMNGQSEIHGKLIAITITTTPRAPSAEAREAIAALMDEHREHVQAAALVFEGGGFGAATARAVVTGLTLLARHPFPYRVFPALEPAIPWLREHTRQATAAAALATVTSDILRIREAHEQRYQLAG